MAGLREFVVQFGTEEKCIEHLAGLRWPGRSKAYNVSKFPVGYPAAVLDRYAACPDNSSAATAPQSEIVRTAQKRTPRWTGCSTFSAW
jgi:hypothetical protein